MSKTSKTVSAPASNETVEQPRIPLGRPVVVRVIACQKRTSRNGNSYAHITILGDEGAMEQGEWVSLSGDMPTFGTVTTVVIMARKYEAKSENGKAITKWWTTIIGK